ncbi:MAG: transposase [Richelia sp.]|nr:transposase [Richelia sp.]
MLKNTVREATPENYLKEQKLDLQSDRISTDKFEGNQLHLWFRTIA